MSDNEKTCKTCKYKQAHLVYSVCSDPKTGGVFQADRKSTFHSCLTWKPKEDVDEA